MKISICRNCGTEYLSRRALCSSCHSGEFSLVEVESAVVLDSVHLIATPDPFPDQYSIVMFKAGKNTKGFCRAEEPLEPGTEVTLKLDELGPVCLKK